MRLFLILLPVASLALAACGSEGEAGDACEVDADCGDGLVCPEPAEAAERVCAAEEPEPS